MEDPVDFGRWKISCVRQNFDFVGGVEKTQMAHSPWINPIYGRWGGICLKVGERIDIGGVSASVILAMVASISLDVAMGGDVVQDPAQVIFMISKNHHSMVPSLLP